jgi:hypothetical protein
VAETVNGIIVIIIRKTTIHCEYLKLLQTAFFKLEIMVLGNTVLTYVKVVLLFPDN